MARLSRSKWEVVAQRMALGDSPTEAYRKAGYNSNKPSRDVYRLLKVHPEIRERAHELSDESFRIQTSTQLISEEAIIQGLMENVAAAKKGSPVINRQGEHVGEKVDFAAVNSGLKILADIKGMIVRKSERKNFEGDPIADADGPQLIEIIEKAFEQLPVNIDLGALSQVLAPAKAARADSDELDEESIEDVQALPETAGVSQPGSELPVPPADGGEPDRKVGVG